jgi:hypothetical protein
MPPMKPDGFGGATSMIAFAVLGVLAGCEDPFFDIRTDSRVIGMDHHSDAQCVGTVS